MTYKILDSAKLKATAVLRMNDWELSLFVGKTALLNTTLFVQKRYWRKTEAIFYPVKNICNAITEYFVWHSVQCGLVKL